MSRPVTLTVVRRTVIVALLLAIATGWLNVDAPGPGRRPVLDVVVAVDTTTSMAAQDHDAGSRIAAVRDDLVALSEALPAARYTVVPFASDAQVALRSATDPVVVTEQLEGLDVEAPTDGDGSRVDRALPLLADLVGPDVTQAVDASAVDDLRRVLVFVSDGENTAAGTQDSFSDLAEDLDAALVLGYGTAEGGQMPADAGSRSPRAGAGLVIDPETGAPALSRIDEGNLRQIAEETEGAYVHRTGSADMAEVAADLEQAAYASLEEVDAERQVTWMWALLLLGLLLWELRLAWRGLLEGVREVRA